MLLGLGTPEVDRGWRRTAAATSLYLVSGVIRPLALAGVLAVALAPAALAAPTWVAPVSLSSAGDTIATPSVSLADGGLGIEAWSENNGTRQVIRVAQHALGGSWTTLPGDISSSLPGDACNPTAAIDPAGNALVVWAQYAGPGCYSGAQTILSARRPAGASAFTAPAVVAPAGTYGDWSPVGASNANGQIVIGFQTQDATNSFIWGAVGSTTSGFEAPTRLLAAPLADALYYPAAAIGPSGDAAVQWQHNAGSNANIEIALHPKGGTFPTTPMASDLGDRTQPRDDRLRRDQRRRRRRLGLLLLRLGAVLVVVRRARPRRGRLDAAADDRHHAVRSDRQLDLSRHGRRGHGLGRLRRDELQLGDGEPLPPAAVQRRAGSRRHGQLVEPGAADRLHLRQLQHAGAGRRAVGRGRRELGDHDAVERRRGGLPARGRAVRCAHARRRRRGLGHGRHRRARAVGRRRRCLRGSVTDARVAVFDTSPPAITAATVPATATVGQAVPMSTVAADAWSPLAANQPAWSFGDGAGAAGASVSHAYAAPGTYTVTIGASDALGLAAPAVTRQITISAAVVPPPPPTPATSIAKPKTSLRYVASRLVGSVRLSGTSGAKAVLTVTIQQARRQEDPLSRAGSLRTGARGPARSSCPPASRPGATTSSSAART